MKKSCIFNLNHIDTNLSQKEIDKYKQWYYFYHKLHICCQWKYKKLTKLKLSLDMTGIGLTVLRTILGSLTLNPVILRSISGTGILISSYSVKSCLEKKIEQCKFAYTSYHKILTEIIKVVFTRCRL